MLPLHLGQPVFCPSPFIFKLPALLLRISARPFYHVNIPQQYVPSSHTDSEVQPSGHELQPTLFFIRVCSLPPPQHNLQHLFSLHLDLPPLQYNLYASLLLPARTATTRFESCNPLSPLTRKN